MILNETNINEVERDLSGLRVEGGVSCLQKEAPHHQREEVYTAAMENHEKTDETSEEDDTETEDGTQGDEGSRTNETNHANNGEKSQQDDRNLFVGDLARGLTENDLEQAFSVCGKVVHASIKRDRLTGKNLGYGFVKMGTREEAVAAKEQLSGAELRGRKIRIGWAQKTTALYVGTLDTSVTIEMLKEAFSPFGVIEADKTVVKDGPNGRYGYVKFVERGDAENARKNLNGREIWPNTGIVRVDWNNMQGHYLHGNAYFRGFTVHVQMENESERVINEDFIRAIFAPFGYILGVSFPSRSNSDAENQSKKKTYVFVHFPGDLDGERRAWCAIEALSGKTMEDVKLTCTVSNHPKKGHGRRGRSGRNRYEGYDYYRINRYDSKLSSTSDRNGMNTRLPRSFHGYAPAPVMGQYPYHDASAMANIPPEMMMAYMHYQQYPQTPYVHGYPIYSYGSQPPRPIPRQMVPYTDFYRQQPQQSPVSSDQASEQDLASFEDGYSPLDPTTHVPPYGAMDQLMMLNSGYYGMYVGQPDNGSLSPMTSVADSLSPESRTSSLQEVEDHPVCQDEDRN